MSVLTTFGFDDEEVVTGGALLHDHVADRAGRLQLRKHVAVRRAAWTA